MSLKRAQEIGVEIKDNEGEFEFVETWEKDGTRLEVRNVKTSEPLRAAAAHYVRKVNIENGEVIWTSEVYSGRSAARKAALAEFEYREDARDAVGTDD